MVFERRNPVRAERAGFTLVEMIVVVAILGLLLAFVSPVLFKTLNLAGAESTRTLKEMERLAQALETFKAKYGIYPPSRIVLREDGDYSNQLINGYIGDADPAVQARGRRMRTTRTVFRRMWPRITLKRLLSSESDAGWDLDGDGTADETDEVELHGWECLVFFLGGLRNFHTTDGVSVIGFSADPTNPFDRDTLGVAPLFDFDAGRLVDEDGDRFPEYRDTFGERPYAYFSAYGGSGYVSDDCDWAGQPTHTVATWSSVGPNPYTKGDATPTGRPAVFWNSDTYQLISAGEDGQFGVGGRFVPEDTDTLGEYDLDGDGTVDGQTEADADNLTNFYAQELGK